MQAQQRIQNTIAALIKHVLFPFPSKYLACKAVLLQQNVQMGAKLGNYFLGECHLDCLQNVEASVNNGDQRTSI